MFLSFTGGCLRSANANSPARPSSGGFSSSSEDERTNAAAEDVLRPREERTPFPAEVLEPDGYFARKTLPCFLATRSIELNFVQNEVLSSGFPSSEF